VPNLAQILQIDLYINKRCIVVVVVVAVAFAVAVCCRHMWKFVRFYCTALHCFSSIAALRNLTLFNF